MLTEMGDLLFLLKIAHAHSLAGTEPVLRGSVYGFTKREKNSSCKVFFLSFSFFRKTDRLYKDKKVVQSQLLALRRELYVIVFMFVCRGWEYGGIWVSETDTTLAHL